VREGASVQDRRKNIVRDLEIGRPINSAQRSETTDCVARESDRPKDQRDRALLLIGFAGGLRRSELVAINLIDFERVREGIILIIRRSKTDQDGVGRRIGIPFGRTIHCPVRALESWLSTARIEDGPVFRPVDRHQPVSASQLSGSLGSGRVICRVAAAIGIVMN
jgi:integrase